MTTATVSTDSPGERRIAPRRQPAMGTVCRLDPGPDGEPRIGLVWNISATGISMLLHEPREPGSLIPGELETVAGGNILAVTMHVVHVKQLGNGDYFLGGHFQRPLTADEMQPFVA